MADDDAVAAYLARERAALGEPHHTTHDSTTKDMR